MSKYQLYIAAEASSPTEKTTVLKIKKIRSAKDGTWFSFPEDQQGLAAHKKLTELPPIKYAVNSIKARGQYRTINVVLPPEVEQYYQDDAGNFIFNNFVLPETLDTQTDAQNVPVISRELGLPELVACLNKLAEKKDDSLNEIMKHFLVEKFSTRNKNVQAWVKDFEREAARFSLNGPRLIGVFRLCLDQSMNDWFSTVHKKIGIEADWDQWKESLISTFSDDSWTPVRFAYNFRHMAGSFVDFVVKKERLLLDLDHEISDQIILNLIVLGLPIRIQNELSRSSISSVKILISKLKKFDYESPKRTVSVDGTENKAPTSRTSESSGKFRKAPSTEGKKACSFCEKGNRGARYHMEKNCWFKDDKIKTVNNVEIETELNSKIVDPKNL